VWWVAEPPNQEEHFAIVRKYASDFTITIPNHALATSISLQVIKFYVGSLDQILVP